VKRLRQFSILVLLVWVIVRPGTGCSFPAEEEVFTQRFGPDAPYERYVGGHLGLVRGSYRVRHLVVAYNYLNGRPLTKAEQNAAIGVKVFFDPLGDRSWEDTSQGDRLVPGQPYESFHNCLQDAYKRADETLEQRKREHGENNPEVAEWSRGQAAVFSNCSGAGEMPQPLPNASLWLKQDRAYQIAAAQFYSLDYGEALASFKAIAGDHASPWSLIARYLVARTLIRRALLLYTFPTNDMDKLAAANQTVRDGLGAAKAQLEGILRDPAMKPLHAASAQLLDYVEARYDPDQQQSVIAYRLSAPSTETEYKQSVIDLSLIRTGSLNTFWVQAQSGGQKMAERAPMLEWIDDLTKPGNKDRALASWRSTNRPVWLVAAMRLAQPGDQAVPQLVAAAKSVPPDSPAYVTVTYDRLRLEQGAVGVYDELTSLMSRFEKNETRSTINAFADLEMMAAPTLVRFLRNAALVPASDGDADGGEGVPLAQSDTSDYRRPKVEICGVDVTSPTSRHFDLQTTLLLNQRMPLRLLQEAALSNTLPQNLQFEVAHVAWTRAVLLDDWKTARALSPLLSNCQPAFKSWLENYDAATTSDERHVLGFFALMRFTSTNPMMRPGLQRDFAAYDEFRDNWWCGNLKKDASGNAVLSDHYKPVAARAGQPGPKPELFREPLSSDTEQPLPPFLTAQDKADSAREVAALQQIPGAPDYFATQALAWYKVHPDDKRNADLLGFAKRVVRNGCRTAETTELDHQLFLVLQQRYPRSEWAKKYTSWE
jgi:hypothetical protein